MKDEACSIENFENCELISQAHWKKCDDEISIIERNPEGKGTLKFKSSNKCIATQPSDVKHPIAWSKNQKCCDGAIIEFRDDGMYLHIVELKNKVRPNEWRNLKLQFEGMLVNLLAVKGVASLANFKKICAYVGYLHDGIVDRHTASPILLKGGVGTQGLLAKTDDWWNGSLDLLQFKAVELVKLRRDEEGNATYSL
jgi:hypothetical protein